MSPERDDELCRKYPMLYAQRRLPMDRTCMCWGFDFGDGWMGIIDRLSATLEEINRTLEGEKIEAVQAKEKFGSLRLYVGPCPEKVYEKVQAAIDAAEEESIRTCEQCGKPGKPNSKGWITTLCDECRTKT